MKWKNRFTNYNFWISIISAVLLILQALKLEFDIAYINEIATAVLGLLVVIGIVSDPTKIAVREEQIASKNQKNESNNQTEIPIEQKDEIDFDSAENDIKNIIEQIKTDIKSQMQGVMNAEQELQNLVKDSLKKFDIENNSSQESNLIPLSMKNNSQGQSEQVLQQSDIKEETNQEPIITDNQESIKTEQNEINKIVNE